MNTPSEKEKKAMRERYSSKIKFHQYLENHSNKVGYFKKLLNR